MRGYDIRGGRVYAKKSLAVGSRDSSRAGSPEPMLQGLSQLRAQLLQEDTAGPPDNVILSGMVGSKYGLFDVPHIELPVTRELLREKITYAVDETVFHCRVGVIPGLRTSIPDARSSFESIAQIHNLRGEETEALGVFRAMGNPAGSVVMILPGSHTQVLFWENGIIVGILSLITGELYNAVKNSTVLSSSISESVCIDERGKEMAAEGYRLLQEYGYNRALYVLHASNLFGGMSAQDRACALNGIIEGSAADAIFARLDGMAPGRVAVAGGGKLCAVYEAVFSAAEARWGQQFTLEVLHADAEMPFSVQGFLSLMGE